MTTDDFTPDSPTPAPVYPLANLDAPDSHDPEDAEDDFVLVEDPKPGWQTTEFWTTAVTIIAGLLVSYGALTPESVQDLQHLGAQLGELAFQALGLIAAVIAAVRYGDNRTRLKS